MDSFKLGVIMLIAFLGGGYFLIEKENNISVKLSPLDKDYSTEEFSTVLGIGLLVLSFSCVPAWIALVFEIDWLRIPSAIFMGGCVIGGLILESIYRYRRRKKSENQEEPKEDC